MTNQHHVTVDRHAYEEVLIMPAYKAVLLSTLICLGFTGSAQANETANNLDSIAAYTMLSSQTADSGARRPSRRSSPRRHFTKSQESKTSDDIAPERGSGRREVQNFFSDY